MHRRRANTSSRSGIRDLLGPLAMVLALASSLQAQIFDFTIVPAASGLDASINLAVPTSGTLIGNWDPAKNPGGTRTKPGLFGTFGPTENVSVPVTAGLGIGGPLNTSTSGAFQLTLDPGNSSAQIAGYAANFLHGGAANLPITLNLLYDSFRTRVPDSTFIGGIPLPIPLGQASLTQLSIAQVGGGGGSLKQTGPGTYDFFITPIVELTAEFVAMGQPFIIPGVPTPFPLEGTISVTGNTAVLTSIRAFEFGEELAVNQPLPQLPFELPTILPPGETAHLLMDLTVGTVSASFSGTGTVHATGVLIPAPGAAMLVASGGLILLRRRR